MITSLVVRLLYMIGSPATWLTIVLASTPRHCTSALQSNVKVVDFSRISNPLYLRLPGVLCIYFQA